MRAPNQLAVVFALQLAQPEGSASGRLKGGEPFPSPSVYHCFCQSAVAFSQRPEQLHFHRSSFPFILH